MAGAAQSRAAAVLDEVPDCEWWDAHILRNGSYDDVSDGRWDIKPDKITPYVEHPVPMKPPMEAPPPPPQPLKLTKREQKKLHRRMSTVETDHAARLREYEVMTRAMLADGLLHPLERDMLSDYAGKHGVSEAEHASTVRALGWTLDEFERGVKQDLLKNGGVTRHNTPYLGAASAQAGGENMPAR